MSDYEKIKSKNEKIRIKVCYCVMQNNSTFNLWQRHPFSDLYRVEVRLLWTPLLLSYM